MKDFAPFSPRYSENCILNENLIHRCTQTGHCFCKISAILFLFSKKGLGEPPPPLPVVARLCLGLSILEVSKIVAYELLYIYVEPKFGENSKLCYKDIDSFIVFIKTKDTYLDIAKDVETRFDTSK